MRKLSLQKNNKFYLRNQLSLKFSRNCELSNKPTLSTFSVKEFLGLSVRSKSKLFAFACIYSEFDRNLIQKLKQQLNDKIFLIHLVYDDL